MLKLIIWDLDDTLWQGTLAEGDDVIPIQSRVEAIKVLNEQGVVNSISSKNDFESAKTKLEEFGIFDQFVFPEINFAAKGQAVQRIISDMNLRAPDVVFVDDNPHNLEEVASFVEGIVTYDARTSEFDAFLREAIVETRGGKSRVGKYRIMEKKRTAKAELDGNNEDFLRSSDVRMTVVRTQENLPFAGRLEELVNRTNQLNFLKTRIEPGTLAPFIVDLGKNQVYSLFVWDKFGNYGLVGFAFVRTNTKELRHFTFSCRIMNMGIEEEFAWYLHNAVNGPRVPMEKLPVAAKHHDWITVLDSSTDEAKEAIAVAMGGDSDSSDARVRIMANCQSGSIAHYLNLGVPLEVDNWPQAFRLAEWVEDYQPRGSWLPELVYGAFVDYQEAKWDGEQGVQLYRQGVESFVSKCNEHGSKLIVLLPSDKTENTKGVCFDYTRLNDVWREVATDSNDIEIIELSEHIQGTVVDPRHFTRETLISMAAVLGEKLKEGGSN